MASTPSRESMFSLLPESRTPWSELFFSFGTQALAVVILLWVSILHPDILKPPLRDYHAIELVPTPVPVNHNPQPVKLFRKPLVVAHLDSAPEALHLPAAQPRTKLEDTPAPEVAVTAKKLDQLPAPAAPAIPKQIVVTNTFSTGSSAAPTVALAVSQVQTGGFGDPHGVPAKANNGKPVNIAQAGGFDMPTGPGSGDGTGGSHGARGIVASSGFGGGVATADARSSSARMVEKAGFGDADVPAPPTVRSHPADMAPAKVIPAEILSKPTPAYTAEARDLKIQGEVLVQVVFEASGRIHVVKVVRGLGHGLDDEAIREAEQIRFKPALRDGQPSDFTAVLHFVFQLA